MPEIEHAVKLQAVLLGSNIVNELTDREVQKDFPYEPTLTIVYALLYVASVWHLTKLLSSKDITRRAQRIFLHSLLDEAFDDVERAQIERDS